MRNQYQMNCQQRQRGQQPPTRFTSHVFLLPNRNIFVILWNKWRKEAEEKCRMGQTMLNNRRIIEKRSRAAGRNFRSYQCSCSISTGTSALSHRKVILSLFENTSRFFLENRFTVKFFSLIMNSYKINSSIIRLPLKSVQFLVDGSGTARSGVSFETPKRKQRKRVNYEPAFEWL